MNFLHSSLNCVSCCIVAPRISPVSFLKLFIVIVSIVIACSFHDCAIFAMSNSKFLILFTLLFYWADVTVSINHEIFFPFLIEADPKPERHYHIIFEYEALQHYNYCSSS